MHKGFIKAAAVLGALGVALGAFGAHGLKKAAGTEHADLVGTFQTGVQYQMYHALALLAIAVLYGKLSLVWVKRAGTAFVTGVILFSGSLYVLVLLKLNDMSASWVGPITPFGGLFFIVGWICVLIAAAKKTD